MQFKNKFLSVVALGNFNPAILTPDFLEKICQLNLGPITEWKVPPQQARIMSNIIYERIELLVDFDRFQVMEKEVDNLKDVRLTEIFGEYIKKLPYTPLIAVGINFNFSLVPSEEETINFDPLFNADPDQLLHLVDSPELSFEKKGYYVRGTVVPNKLNITYPLAEERKISVNFTFGTTSGLNFNYEIGGLRENPLKSLAIIQEYSNILDILEKAEKRILERILA